MIAALASTWLYQLPPASAAELRKPNILVMVGDDMGYADISVHGCKDISTPYIDSLAQNGIRCSNGYVSGTYCSPTRAGLMTGRYQTRFGHEFNPGAAAKPAGRAQGLSEKETTLAERLKAAGYTTGLVGKWHLGGAPEYHPMKRGFDEFFGFLGGAHAYFPGKGILRSMGGVSEQEYLTDAFGREAVAFIERHQKEPFFLYLAFNAVHMPLQATQKYLDRFPNITDQKRHTYAGMMSAMDDAVGMVLKKLRQKKMEENTLIFFISDNGGPPVNGSRNTPLAGRKATTWEGGIRVPWLVQWPGKLPGGKVYDQPVIQLDIVPTALAAAGVTPEPGSKLDGVNLLPYFQGKQTGTPHRTLCWRFGPQMAIRVGDWKLVQATGSRGKKLFNLKDDIGETKDLSAAHPEKVKELQAAWNEWNKDNVPPLWKPPRAQKKPAKPGQGI
jgi:arylsulfatase A-like enzyme